MVVAVAEHSVGVAGVALAARVLAELGPGARELSGDAGVGVGGADRARHQAGVGQRGDRELELAAQIMAARQAEQETQTVFRRPGRGACQGGGIGLHRTHEVVAGEVKIADGFVLFAFPLRKASVS